MSFFVKTRKYDHKNFYAYIFSGPKAKDRRKFVDKLIAAYPQLGDKEKWSNINSSGYLDKRLQHVRMMIRKRSLGLRVRQRYEEKGFSSYQEAYENDLDRMYVNLPN